MKRIFLGIAAVGILGATSGLIYMQVNRQLADASAAEDPDASITDADALTPETLSADSSAVLESPTQNDAQISLPATSRMSVARAQGPPDRDDYASKPGEFQPPQNLGHLRSASEVADASADTPDRFNRPASRNGLRPAANRSYTQLTSAEQEQRIPAQYNESTDYGSAAGDQTDPPAAGTSASQAEAAADRFHYESAVPASRNGADTGADDAQSDVPSRSITSGGIPPAAMSSADSTPTLVTPSAASVSSIPPAEPRNLSDADVQPPLNAAHGAASPNRAMSSSTTEPGSFAANAPNVQSFSVPLNNSTTTTQPNSTQPLLPLSSSEGTGRPGVTRLEGPQQPRLAVQKFAPSEIQVGKECVFEVKIRNTGQVAANDVQVFDEVPQGTRLVSTEPLASLTADGKVVWQIGVLGPNDQTSVQMKLMPIEEGEIGSVASVQFAAQASVRAKSTRPELSLRVIGPDEVMIGEKAMLKIEISNPGSGEATGVMLTENVPQGLSHEAGQALEFEVGALAPGETRELELSLTAKQSGKIINSITARADANLQVQENTPLEVIAPKLEIVVKGPKKRFLDRQATYELMVQNPGTAAAQDVELVSRLPEGMKFISANNAGQYDTATHSVYWSLEELPPKQHGTVELVALPVASGEQTLSVETTAKRGLKDKVQQQVLVEGVAAILFEVVDVNDPIVVGEETTYEIRVVNQGSKEAVNVQILAQLPAGLQPTSASGPSSHTIDGDRVVFEPLRRLAAKADTTFRIKAKGLRKGDQRIKVQLVREDSPTPVTKEESTRVFNDE